MQEEENSSITEEAIHLQVSISSMFYEQLFLAQIPKAQKKRLTV